MRKIEPSITSIRLDKNLAQHISGFSVQYGTDSTLMRDLVMYLCHLSQNVGQTSLFDNLVVDIDDFSTKMSYTPSNLRRLHPNARHVEILKTQKQLQLYRDLEPTDMKFHVFETVFENALYRLFKEPFELPKESDYITRKIEGETHVFQSVSLSSVVLIRNLRYYKILGKHSRIKGIYDCTLGDEFKRTLYQYFAQLSINSVVSLRQPKADSLYIYLSSLKDTLASNGRTSTALSFNYLKQQANISRSIAKREKEQLTSKFKLLEGTDLGVTLEWRANDNGGKFVDRRIKYVPWITFDQGDALSPEEQQLAKRRFWFEQFCAEIIIYVNSNITFLKNNSEVEYPITADQDVMQLVLLFILQCRAHRATTPFKYLSPITEVLTNSYKEIWGTPKSVDYKQKIANMAETIIMLNSINEIEKIFLDVNWYSKNQEQQRRKDASFRVGPLNRK